MRLSILAFLFFLFTSTQDVTHTPRVAERTFDLASTMYQPDSLQCDSTPLVTADNSVIDVKKLKRKKLRWVALSRDLLTKWGGEFSYGDTIEVTGHGVTGRWVVHDCMNKRYKRKIDFLTADSATCVNYGMRDVTIRKI